MNCQPSNVLRVKEIQTLENEIRAMGEAKMEQLDFAVSEALAGGIPLNELKIVETTVWETARKFSYSVKVTRK